jgi:hypothetical protein
MEKLITLRMNVKSIFLTLIVLLYLSSCKKSGDELFGNLIKRIEEGKTLNVELIFKCENPLIAVDSDKEGNFYLVSYNGDVFKVSKNGTSENVYSGIKCCGFSLTSITVLPPGDLIVNDCVDDKDVLFRIYKNGGRSKFAEVDVNLLSLASDNSGKVYLGGWVSKGDLTVEFNPNRLSAAEYIGGKILETGVDGNLREIYEGGLPLCMKSKNGEKVFAATWGEKGGFTASKKSYSVADLRHIFWLALTEETKIISINDEKEINTGDLNSISAFEFLSDGSLVVQAIPRIGGAGLYLLKDGADPIELTFSEEKTDHSITGLEVSNGNLYFINVEGKLYRIK